MPGAKLTTDLWVTEYISETEYYAHGVEEVIAASRTEFQDMLIVRSGASGKALVLDGKWQSCSGDEFLYHEPLVHPACCLQGGPKRVLVLGGGEGATVREALRWRSVENVTMVDIDEAVVAACREHLPEMHQGALDDPRTKLVFDDALHVLDQSAPGWDVIVSDLSDPIAEGPSFKLFTREYFEKCLAALAEGGVFVVQAGPVSPQLMSMHVKLANTVADVFPHVAHYCSGTPTYGSPWGFVVGRREPIPTDPDPDAIDRLLSESTTGGFRAFDGRWMRSLMNPPKYLRDAAAAETEVFTLEKPARFFGSGVAEEG